MKNIKTLVLISTFVVSLNSFAQSPCAGEPQVICSQTLKLSEKLAERNFRDYGRDIRRIFRGYLHTIDSNGLEHKGPAMGRNLYHSGEDARFQGTQDKQLFATLGTSYWGPTKLDLTYFEPEHMHLKFGTFAKGVLEFTSLQFNDPRLKGSHLQRVQDLNRWTIVTLDARDLTTRSGDPKGIKQISMKAVLPVTLNDLIEASVVPSYTFPLGADLDLAKAFRSGDLQVGASSAVLKTRNHVVANRTDLTKPFSLFGQPVPDHEIPGECLKSDRVRVDYESTLDIPLANLGGTTVTSVKTRVSCQASGLHMGRITKIDSKTNGNNVEVVVTYLRACNETFETLVEKDWSSRGLFERIKGVGIVMSSTGVSCTGKDTEETTTFSYTEFLDKRWTYSFEKISPKGSGALLTPAVIESITPVEPLGGKVQVAYTGKMGCSERTFRGHKIIFPLKSGKGRYGFLVLAEDLGNQCSTEPRVFWDEFEVPEIPGGYSFVAVE